MCVAGFIMEAFQNCWARIRPQRGQPLEENSSDEETPVKTDIHVCLCIFKTYMYVYMYIHTYIHMYMDIIHTYVFV